MLVISVARCTTLRAAPARRELVSTNLRMTLARSSSSGQIASAPSVRPDLEIVTFLKPKPLLRKRHKQADRPSYHIGALGPRRALSRTTIN